jgi:hypothetical protein
LQDIDLALYSVELSIRFILELILPHDKVTRFDITMNNLVIVQMFDSDDELQCDHYSCIQVSLPPQRCLRSTGSLPALRSQGIFFLFDLWKAMQVWLFQF